jgi:threonine dehydrogenase-like Zn-dependent dehydrogenase
MWDMHRLECTAVALLASGALQVKPLIGARVPFDQAAKAYALIDGASAGQTKVLLTYPD